MALNKYVQAAYSETKDNASGSRASNLNRFVQSAYSSDRINYLLEQSKPSPVITPKPKAPAKAAIVKPTTGPMSPTERYKKELPAPDFAGIRKQNAVQNASSRLFKMDDTLMGQAVSNAKAVTQQMRQPRADEIQRKLAEAQQQRAQDLQAKITELQHQQDIYFDANREAELEKAKRDYANVEETLQKTSLAADTVGKGAGMFNQGAANFADFVSNAIPRVEGWLMGVEPEETFTGQLLKPATKATSAVKDYVDTTVAKIDENAAEKIGDSKAKQTAYNLGSGTVAALPQAVLAMMTMGGSTATQLPAQSSGLVSTVSNALKKAMSKPTFKLSFAQQLGSDYEEAKAQGATDMEAMVSATISSYVNALIESSGGIDELPGEIRDLDLTTPQKAWRWVVSMLDEGKEGTVQNVVTQMTNKGIFAEDTPLISATDENAVFNPKRMVKDFASEAAVGGILSGGQVLAQSGINAATKTDSRYNEMMRDLDSIMPRLPEQNKNAPVINDQSVENAAPKAITVSPEGSESLSAANGTTDTIANEGSAFKTKWNNFLEKSPKDSDWRRFVSELNEQESNELYVLIEEQEKAGTLKWRSDGAPGLAMPAEDHIDNRDYGSVGNRNVRSFQYNNPELQPFFRKGLEILGEDLERSSPGERYYNGLDPNGIGSQGLWSGQKRHTTPEIAKLKDDYNMSWADINKAWSDLWEDAGRENNAKAKRLELLVDKILTEGHKGLDGTVYPENRAYIEAKGKIAGARPVQKTDDTVSDIDFLDELDRAEATKANPAMGDVGDMGAKTSDFPHEVKESQSKTTPAYHEQHNIPEEGRADNHYTAVTEAESLHNARLRLEQDYEGEVAEMRAKTTWSNEEMDMGQMVLDDLRTKAEETGDWSEFREWDKVNREHKSEAGRALQALAKQNRNTATDIMSNASEALESAKDGTDTNDVMNTVSDYATRYEVAAETKDVDGLLQIIHDTSVTRKTGTRKGGLSKEIDWALKRIADYARAELVNANQTDAIAPAPPIQNYTLKTGDRVTVSDRDNIGTIVSVNDDGTYTVHFKSRQGHEATKTFTGDMVKKLGQKKTTITYLSSTSEVGKFYDFLRNFAANGIEAIATDKQKTSLGEAYLTIRRNAMLSKAATIMRNLVGNNVFDPLDSMANNMSVPLDMLLSKFTGTRSVAVDKSWASEAKRKGSMDGLAMALLEVGLDVNSDSAASKYENAGTRTFHMANGVFSKLMSTWEKYMGYALSATDEFQKGGIAAETQRGIDKLYEQGKIKDDTLRDAGEQEALYRTFQDENAVSGLVQDLRRAANNRFSRGGVGAGDLLVPFAQVPSTLPVRAAEYSPIGLANGIGKMAKVLLDAKKGTLTAAQQASAVKDFGRGLTGSAMIAAAAALAAKGIIHVVAPGGEDENKDKAASEKAQGLSGTQWNLDATIRAIKGESAEWQDGDTVMSIAFLDPINAQLTTGALIAEDAENDKATFGRILEDSFSGALQSFLDLPVMQTAREFANAYTYSDEETVGGKVKDAAKQWAAGEATSVIPNALKGIAQGTDEHQRDLYAKDDIVGQTVDNIVGSIPGLRQKFTTKKQDVYGNDVKNPNQPLNFLNSNILPGAITTYTETDLQAALNALSEETGVNTMYLSKNPPKSISVDGTKVELTDEQQRQFMTERGGLYESASAALETDKTYRDFSGEWKLKAYEYAEDYATQKAKEGLDERFEPETWVSDLDGATPEEFSEALVQRVVESMAKKAGENKYQGMGNLLSDQSIDDQIAISLMSKEASDTYTAFTEVMNVPVQQFLDIYGTATAASKKKDEQWAAAVQRIRGMDISNSEKYTLEFGMYYSFMMGKELREKYNAHVKGSSISNGTYMDAAKYYDAYKAEEHGGVERAEAMYDYVVSVCPNMTAAKTLFLGFFAESTWEKERKK